LKSVFRSGGLRAGFQITRSPDHAITRLLLSLHRAPGTDYTRIERDTIMKKLTFLCVMLMGAVAFGQSPSKADPWAGTWKLDAGKSKLQGPPPKEETVISQGTGATGNDIKYSISGTGADGKPFSQSYDGKADGKQYPAMANGQEVAKISYHKDSSHHYTGTGTAPDGTTTSSTVTLSKDGKTITVQEHVKGPQGEFDQTAVYNKQ
jgi:hypothetical protein